MSRSHSSPDTRYAPRSSLAFVALATFVAALPLAAQRAEPIDARTRSVIGCYELAISRWVAGTDTAAIPAHRPPTRFRLDSLTRDRFPSGYYQVEPSSGGTLLNIDSWRWMDSERIVITWSASTVAGVRLDIHVSTDSLIGSAASFDETVAYDRPYVTARVVARRVVCRAFQ